jgi:glycosyltransferase involved in cell wall biosynthesis
MVDTSRMTHAPAPLAIPLHVGSVLKRGFRCAAEGDTAGALEALAATALIDIQQHQQQFLGDVRGCAALAQCANGWLGGWAAGHAGRPIEARPNSSEPTRVLYVMPSLAQGHAASANLVRLVDFHMNRSPGKGTIEPAVVICDEMTARTPKLPFLSLLDTPSERAGAEHLAKLRALCEVTVLPAQGTFLDAAARGIEAARAFAPDVAVFTASPACAVQTAMAAARVAPVQVCLNIGVPLLSRGIDAVIYNNPLKEARDAEFVRALGIAVTGVLTSGGDAHAGAQVAPFPRQELGLPEGVPVVACMSNVLARRMLAGTFAADLVAFLRRNPDVWWLGIGFCDPEPVRAYLRGLEDGADIARRCVFTGGWSKPWGMIKSCDVVLNEYPEGGGNAVIESMGCGVPVVAMRAGDRHAEAIGAVLVGPDAIPAPDIAAYWALAERWIRNPAEARAAGERQRARAQAQLDYAVICPRYEQAILGLARSAPRAAVPAAATA